ncbi:MAG: hypothetical protein HYV28_06460, partial [Ignavibacteriales bacterium]|nr:hypothetical protein [Ignavibacteriales bacterium]
MKLAVNIFCISILFSIIPLKAQYAVLPWVNNSAYYGKWKLAVELPSYASKLSREMFNLDFISPSNFLSISDSVQENYFTSEIRPDIEILKNLTAKTHAEYAILGEIE